jgi:hypothetical protein
MTFATAALVPADHPGSWSTFFTLTGSAAATLTGLFFVAFSLRVRELELGPILRTRARYMLVWLITIAIGSGLVVMPGQSRAVLAAEILVLSVGCAAYTVWFGAADGAVWSHLQSPPIWSAGGSAWGQPGCSASARGSAWSSGTAAGCTLLAFAMLLGIALEVAAAWTLIVEAGHDTKGRDVFDGRQDQVATNRARFYRDLPASAR